MTERDQITEKTPDKQGARADDRRREVKPTEHPVPSSPPPDEHALREGEEKLERVKPY